MALAPPSLFLQLNPAKIIFSNELLECCHCPRAECNLKKSVGSEKNMGTSQYIQQEGTAGKEGYHEMEHQRRGKCQECERLGKRGF